MRPARDEIVAPRLLSGHNSHCHHCFSCCLQALPSFLQLLLPTSAPGVRALQQCGELKVNLRYMVQWQGCRCVPNSPCHTAHGAVRGWRGIMGMWCSRGEFSMGMHCRGKLWVSSAVMGVAGTWYSSWEAGEGASTVYVVQGSCGLPWCSLQGL